MYFLLEKVDFHCQVSLLESICNVRKEAISSFPSPEAANNAPEFSSAYCLAISSEYVFPGAFGPAKSEVQREPSDDQRAESKRA